MRDWGQVIGVMIGVPVLDSLREGLKGGRRKSKGNGFPPCVRRQLKLVADDN